MALLAVVPDCLDWDLGSQVPMGKGLIWESTQLDTELGLNKSSPIEVRLITGDTVHWWFTAGLPKAKVLGQQDSPRHSFVNFWEFLTDSLAISCNLFLRWYKKIFCWNIQIINRFILWKVKGSIFPIWHECNKKREQLFILKPFLHPFTPCKSIL